MEAIPAGGRVSEAMGKENTVTVNYAITQDKLEHRKDSS